MLAKLQQALAETKAAQDKLHAQNASLSVQLQSVAAERDGALSMLAQEEHARRQLLTENNELDRRVRVLGGAVEEQRRQADEAQQRAHELQRARDRLALDLRREQRKAAQWEERRALAQDVVES